MILLCGHAHADEASLVLDWEAPWSCPSERAVRRTVHDWLAQARKPQSTRGIRVRASVQKEADGFTLDLRLEMPGGSGREQLHAVKCETLVGVVALKIALLADPDALLRAPPPPQPHREAEFWGLRLVTALGPGPLPGLGPFLELAASRRFGFTAIDLGVGYGFPNTIRYSGLEAGARVDLFYARPRFCVLPNLNAVDLPICLGVDLGLMRARGLGRDLDDVFTSKQFYAAAALGAALRWPKTGWIAGWIGGEALFSLVRPDFYARNLGSLYAPDPFGGRVQAGVECRFR